MNHSDKLNPFLDALDKAKEALAKGDKTTARFWAQKAIQIDPGLEDPWLVLAAVSNPRASIEYLNQALVINPESKRARQGMHWAVRRLRLENQEQIPKISPVIPTNFPTEALVRQKPVQFPLSIIFLSIVFLLLVWFSYPELSKAWSFSRDNNLVADPITPVDYSGTATIETGEILMTPDSSSTLTSTLTLTPTSPPTTTNTQTPLPTDTPTATPTDTLLPTPTDTPLPSPTETVIPSEALEPTRGPDGKFNMPAVQPGQRWIDVDLSQQRVYAFEGNQIINSFRVSTGTSRTPTVTGTYKIYVKYRSADMSGPGYHLSDVPFVMYFFKGYGLHGTYWHSNFGTPMSHGCVNLKTKDAKWLFDWASVGTIVNVHR